MRLFRRLRRWFYPIPPEHRDLAAAFALENQEYLRRFLRVFFTIGGALVVLLGVPVNFLIAEDVPRSVVDLQTTGMAMMAMVVLFTYLPRMESLLPAIGPGTIVALWWMAYLVLAPLSEPRMIVFSVLAVVLLGLMPLPPPWLFGSYAVMNLLAVVGTTLLAGRADPVMLRSILTSIVVNSCLFTGIFALLTRQRWKVFLSAHQIRRLNADLSFHNARLQGELALARTIQQQLLPPSARSWPQLELAALSAPALEVGGDFYGYYDLGPQRLAIAVGDVSGKGLPAALLMAAASAVLPATIQSANTPAALLDQMDLALSPAINTTRQNCALCYVEVRGAELWVANAGCIPPLVRQPDGAIDWVDAVGLPLGASAGLRRPYNETHCQLQPGALIVLISDGVVEATSASGELLGFERLAGLVASGPAASPGAMLAHLQAAVAAFIGGAPPHDDLTIVVARYVRPAPIPAL